MGTTWHYGQIDENASAVAAWWRSRRRRES